MGNNNSAMQKDIQKIRESIDSIRKDMDKRKNLSLEALTRAKSAEPVPIKDNEFFDFDMEYPKGEFKVDVFLETFQDIYGKDFMKQKKMNEELEEDLHDANGKLGRRNTLIKKYKRFLIENQICIGCGDGRDIKDYGRFYTCNPPSPPRRLSPPRSFYD